LGLAVAEPPESGQGVQVMPTGVLVLIADLCLQQVFQRQLVDAEVFLVPQGGAEVDPKRSGAGSLVTMEERPVSGPLGAVRGARLLDLIIQVRNAASLRRLRRLAQGQGEPSTARDC
jgi:hypothetical protein